MLWRENQGYNQQPLANIAEDPKFRAFNHTEGSLKRSDMNSWIPYISQQAPGVEMGLSRKDLWRNLLSNGMNSRGIHRRPTWFLKMSFSRNTAS